MTTKTIFVLNINEYEPEVTKHTYPLIEQYADRIGAQLTFITKRKYPDHPVTFEKFQIYDLASSDWSIYIDSDVLIHPEFYDITSLVTPDTVVVPDNNVALGRYEMDKYFRRDGRYISVANYMSFVSSDCMDYWKPDLNRTPEEIISSVYKVPRDNFFNPQHRVDDYICSRNISKYGLKVEYIHEIFHRIYDHSSLEYWHHADRTDMSKADEILDKSQCWTY